MTRPGQKALELRQLALVRKQSPGFLPGLIDVRGGNERDEPDLIVQVQPQKVIGIEMTAIRESVMVGGYAPAVIEAAQQRIIEVAHGQLRNLGGPRISVNVCVGGGPYEIDKIAIFLVEMIIRHEYCGFGVSAWPSQGVPVELHASFWPCASDENDEWTISSVGETKLLSEEQIRAAILRKGKKAIKKQYREGFSEIWLLIVATMFPASADFVPPPDATTWSFAHPFDQVFVFSQGSGELLNY